MAAVPTHYEALSEYLAQHVRAEEGALDAYERALEDRPDDVATYLIRLILADEARHHQIFAELKNSLDSSIQWREIEPRVPPTRIEGGDVQELLAATETLLALEHDDAKELKHLRREWEHGPPERKLWALLVETAELDTQKHIRVLEFLRSLLRDAATTA